MRKYGDIEEAWDYAKSKSDHPESVWVINTQVEPDDNDCVAKKLCFELFRSAPNRPGNVGKNHDIGITNTLLQDFGWNEWTFF